MEIIKNILYELLSIFFSYGPLIMYLFLVPRTLHYMQLSGYKNSEFIRWFTKNPKLAFKSNLDQLIGAGLYYLVTTLINYFILEKMNYNNAIIVLFIEYIGMIAIYFITNIIQALKDKNERKSAKKPLVYTARAKRLIFWNFITVALLEVSFLDSFRELNIITYQMVRTLCYSLFIFVLPVNMIISNFLGSPTERFINERYVSSAKRKLRKKAYKNLIKIGITGSYRKNKHKIYFRNNFKRKIQSACNTRKL